MKNIDADKLKAEITRLEEMDYPCDTLEQSTGFYDALDRIKSFIGSLQQEEISVECCVRVYPTLDNKPRRWVSLYKHGVNVDSIRDKAVLIDTYAVTFKEIPANIISNSNIPWQGEYGVYVDRFEGPGSYFGKRWITYSLPDNHGFVTGFYEVDVFYPWKGSSKSNYEFKAHVSYGAAGENGRTWSYTFPNGASGQNLTLRDVWIPEGTSTINFSPGTEVDYAVDVCNAVLDIWKPTAEKKTRPIWSVAIPAGRLRKRASSGE